MITDSEQIDITDDMTDLLKHDELKCRKILVLKFQICGMMPPLMKTKVQLNKH